MSVDIKFVARTKVFGERFYLKDGWASNGHWIARLDTVENKAVHRAVKGLAEGGHVYGYDVEPSRLSQPLVKLIPKNKGNAHRAVVTTEAKMRYDGASVECLAVKVESLDVPVGEVGITVWVSPTYVHLLLECSRLTITGPRDVVKGFKTGNETDLPDVAVMPMRF